GFAGQTATAGLVSSHKVLGSRSAGRLVEGTDATQSSFAHSGNHVFLIEQGTGAHDLDLAVQLVVLHLLVETHSVGTGQKRVDKLGIAGGQIHQDRCEVGCAQGRPDALTQRAALFLISIGEVFNVFAASGVIRTQRDAAGFFNVLEGPQGAGVAQHPAGFGGAEYVGAGCFTSQAIGSGIGNEGRQLRIVHDVTNGQCDIGADDTAQNVDLVALDQLAHFTDGFVRFAVVIFYQQLHLAPAHLVIALSQHHLQTGAHAFGQEGEGAGQGCQQG